MSLVFVPGIAIIRHCRLKLPTHCGYAVTHQRGYGRFVISQVAQDFAGMIAQLRRWGWGSLFTRGRENGAVDGCQPAMPRVLHVHKGAGGPHLWVFDHFVSYRQGRPFDVGLFEQRPPLIKVPQFKLAL